MSRGVVRSFNAKLGFGFIECLSEIDLIFFHHTQIKGITGYRTLPIGAKITFDIYIEGDKLIAKNVTLTED